MLKFYIQVNKAGKFMHDFALALNEACDYANWKTPGSVEVAYGGFTRLATDDSLADHIPVGGVAFVQEFLNRHHQGVPIKPIYIPDELKHMKYLKRMFSEGTKETIVKDDSPVFVKQIDQIKGFAEVIDRNTDLPDGNLFITEALTILTEWRIFVENGEVIGAKNYSGDFFLLPDKEFIEQTVAAYTEAPGAYTLDVMVDARGETSVVEVHDFVSCGLYGYADLTKLPSMMARGFRSMVTRSVAAAATKGE